MSSSKQVALVVGASRGIGRQIAIGLASNGYRVIVSAKSTSDASNVHPFPPDPNSPQSTINTVAREIQEAGGEAVAIAADTRDPEAVKSMVDQAVAVFGRMDVLVYNPGAIWWASVENTPFKRFKLMQQVNVEGLYATIQAALPHFKKQDWKGRIIVISPPIYSRFFRGKTAYAMGKVAMSVLSKGLAMDFVREGKKDMAISSLWVATGIESAATVGREDEIRKDLRKPTIVSDAILAMLRAPTTEVNGLLDVDEDFLRKTGVTDFSKYSLVPGATPRRIMPAEFPDLTVAEQDDEGQRMDSTKMRSSRM
ncbi:Short-chain dehydrogenase/reductase SDR [Macrophomina phaseolina MS6]|uniref:Short-chain dehydrogenase/reductase SDR n=2 Tax=Macrophomina phaseolina TaxID=35725 RepID=K2SAK1_MACPH|nr:Short-chain dehydrogenase/reductase SDR [Macrophomina phaseolina MS6]KAH7052276.1 putative oxidoreductase,short chain dehydrogenase [Macrophomina phaseolina]